MRTGSKRLGYLRAIKRDGLEGYIFSLFLFLFEMSIYFFLRRRQILTQVAASKESGNSQLLLSPLSVSLQEHNAGVHSFLFRFSKSATLTILS